MTDKETLDALEQNCRMFQLCFNTPVGQQVLTYLADFCRAGETCVAIPSEGGPIDIHKTFVLEGRREVFLRIQRYLNLTPRQLFRIATGQTYQEEEPNG